MANQKSTIHEIPLKTQDLCLNVFNADIKPYEGFRKNNSPFYGSTLSPFYYKKSAAVGDKTYVHTDGAIYTIKDDGNLYAIADNEIKLLDLSGGHFLEKNTIYSSGNESYPTILGFFDEGTYDDSIYVNWSNEYKGETIFDEETFEDITVWKTSNNQLATSGYYLNVDTKPNSTYVVKLLELTFDGAGIVTNGTVNGTLYKLYDIDPQNVSSYYIKNGNNFEELKVNQSSHTFTTNPTTDNNFYIYQKVANEPTRLCSSNEGDLAIINSDGTVKVAITMNDGYTYKGNETVGFMERSSAGAYCFVLGNSVFCTNVAGTTAYRYVVGSANDRANSYAYSCVTSNETSTFTVCIKNNDSISATILNVVYGSTVTFNLVADIKGKLSASTITDTNSSGKHDLFFTKSGHTIFASNVFRVKDGSQYKVFNFATGMKRASGDSVTQVSCQIVESKYLTIENLEQDKYEQLYSVCDNYSATEVLGYSNGGYTKTIPGEWHYGVEPIMGTQTQTMLVPNGLGGFNTVTYNIPTVIGYKPITYKDPDTYVEVPGGYKSVILNGVTGQSYQGVPIHVDGTYTGGFIASFGDNFRLLYQSGHLQAISVCPDERTVGTLVCGMGEIDTTFPICFASTRKTVYYKNDSGTWESVTLSSDTAKASLSLANDRYLIINTDRYYNCFDIVDRTLHHFASDWNDRVILETEATFEKIPNTLDGYIENCEQYLYTSAQGSNYVLLNTPFISSLFGANSGMIPKTLTAINPKAIAGYTPNNQDIDVYYDKVSTDSNGPKYRYSIDM